MDSQGYDLGIAMDFPRGVLLSQVVADLKNPVLLHELNPVVEPLEILDRGDSKFDTLLTFHVLGMKKQMLSHCRELSAASWEKSCELDTSQFGSGTYMDGKKEEVGCEQDDPLSPVHCAVRIRGKIKSVFWIRASTLTIKAKYQALLNWGRLWYFIQTQSLSPKLALELYEKSKLREGVDQFLKEGLEAAKQGEDAGFRLEKRGVFHP